MTRIASTKLSLYTSPCIKASASIPFPSYSPSPTTSINSRNFVSFRSVYSFIGKSMSQKGSSFSIESQVQSPDGAHRCSFKGSEAFFRSMLASVETVYLSRNPTAKAILELVRSVDGGPICYDHLAFRTFGVNGHGIDSIANFFLDFGYVRREELRFPAKKLKAFWFAPPDMPYSVCGSGINGPLPRIFISELLVDQMSHQAQGIIEKYIQMSGDGYRHAALASAMGSLTWDNPSVTEFQQLARYLKLLRWPPHLVGMEPTSLSGQPPL